MSPGNAGLGKNPYPPVSGQQRPIIRNVYLTFQGVGFSSGYRTGFDVMCGAKPPTITGGYAEYSKVKRPLQRSLTIFTGYEPMQLTVDVIFGTWVGAAGWQQSDSVGKQVEQNIRDLGWMAGSGFKTGPSPAVYVYSHSTDGGDSNLIPPDVSGPQFPWVITNGIQWGQSWRNPNGYRTYQEATVVLENYLNFNTPPQPDTTVQGGYFTTIPGRDTALLIAAAPSGHSPLTDNQILAQRICSDPKNNPCKGTSISLARKGIHGKIKLGISVWVPTHQGF